MQNDFIDGSLAVPGAEQIIDNVEELTRSDLWYQVLYSQDWHPRDHISFYSNLGLRQLDPTWLSVNNTSVDRIKMFDEVVFKRYPPYKQKLWPDHCVQDSEGNTRIALHCILFMISIISKIIEVIIYLLSRCQVSSPFDQTKEVPGDPEGHQPLD